MENTEAIKILYIVLLIMGSFISVLLLVNGFFTRKTLEKMTSVDLRLAVLITKHDHTDERSRKNEFQIEKMKAKQERLELEVRAIKGE